MKSTIPEKFKRDTNLDLLRIVSMLLIVLIHSIDHSGVLEAAENSSPAMYFYVRFTYALCMVCVNCYVLLSGYYLVTSKFKFQKLIVLWMETVFYALTLRIIFILFGERPFSIVSLVSCFFPFLTGRYWFITIYVGMYLAFPFLNILIHAMDRKTHTALNLCLFLLFSLWNSIHPAIAGMNSGGGWGLAWFVVLYMLAAWFRLYYKPSRKPGSFFLLFLLIPLLIASAQLLFRTLGIGIFQSILANWFKYNSAPVYFMTLCLFVAFLNVRIKDSISARIISVISPLTFGVYLIHAQADVSPWLWDTLNMPARMNSIFFPVEQLLIVFGIFAICIVIDYLRKISVGRLENCSLIKYLSEILTNRLSTLI